MNRVGNLACTLAALSLAALALMGAATLQAQTKPSTAQEQARQEAAVKSMLATMSNELPIAAVPEAQQATRARIDAMFEAMHWQDQMKQVMDGASKAISATIQQAAAEQQRTNPDKKQMSPEEQKIFDAMLHEYMGKLEDIVNSEDVIGPMKASYKRYLTADDVEGIISFYNSPAGQHLIQRQTKISLEAAPVMMNALQTKLQALIADMQKKIAAMQPKKPVDAPANK